MSKVQNNESAPVQTDPVVVGTGRQALERIVRHSDHLIRQLRELSFEPSGRKQLERRYKITQVARMVGRSASAIRKAEAEGHLPSPETTEQGRRTGYTLAGVNAIRDHFRVNPYRAADEPPIRLAFQNFKGGVGKSTCSVHFAQYMAEQGYRVLLVDCDSQASATMTFGYQPDEDLGEGDTLEAFFLGDESGVEYAIKPTYWDRLDLIPANLRLYSAEYALAARGSSGTHSLVDYLDYGLSTVEDRYDVVVLDPPPALGMIALNVARAADALIIPTSPAMADFHSTVSFFRMMEEVLETVEANLGQPIHYRFVKILVSKFNVGKGTHADLAALMSEHYARNILNANVKDSAEIDNAAAEWKTVYELEKPTTSAQTYKRCVQSLGAVFREIEILIRREWPSHAERLEAEQASAMVNLPSRR